MRPWELQLMVFVIFVLSALIWAVKGATFVAALCALSALCFLVSALLQIGGRR